MMTYGDGVADIPLDQLLDFHRSHGKLATVTAVHPVARFGQMDIDGDQVRSFIEKPQLDAGWINGGFFVLEPEVFDYIPERLRLVAGADGGACQGGRTLRLPPRRLLAVHGHHPRQAVPAEVVGQWCHAVDEELGLNNGHERCAHRRRWLHRQSDGSRVAARPAMT